MSENKKPTTARRILKLNGSYKGVNAGELAGFDDKEADHILAQKIRQADGSTIPAAVEVKPTPAPAAPAAK